ncbi:endonuclease [Cronobacter phage vB_CsaM_GAP32]|uniref:Zinc-ribbon domain-containing protein n=1 Tax=Cronobacter phage vB_CsaM_GAP32 TaxID=1141136 RepID=K4F7A9_9CAUD|nr:endonuclease [Cronobacter phage vB_CsaM_GAP32]AFC21953.1 hypothetical protein GAP32_494 [Cronobacter phage vB_CsaM_GAP32]
MAAKFTQKEVEKKVKNKCKKMNYKVEKFVYTTAKKTKLLLTCEHGHTWNSTSVENFLRTSTGCPKCSGTKKLTQDEAVENVTSKCLELNYKFEPFIYICAKKTLLTLTCNNGHTWNTTTYHKLLQANKNYGCCKKCGSMKASEKQRFPSEEVIEKVQLRCEELNYKCEPFEYISSVKTKLHLTCDKGHSWNTTICRDFLNGSSCPICKGHSQTIAYINLINDGDISIGLKYGIESTKGRRSKQQNYSTAFEIKRIKSFKFGSVDSCKNAESECKKIFQEENIRCCKKKGILSKKELPDGYTETTYIKNIDKIIEIYKKHGGVEI